MNCLALVACFVAAASANPGLVGLGYAGLGYSGLGYAGLGYATPYAASYAAPLAYAAPIQHSVSSQYHAQDELGQYSYGYSGGPSAKQESRTADGVTRGAYSYIDANGLVQSTSYVSDPINGFRVAATNLPVAPAATAAVAVPAVHNVVPVAVATEARLVDPVAIAAGAPLPTGDSVEVAAAKAAHFQAHAIAKSGLRLKRGLAYAAPIALATEARQIDPVAIAAGAPLPTGDTVEVAAAKAAHLHAHAVESYKHYGYAAQVAPLAYSGYAHATPLAYAGYAHPTPLAYAGYAHAAPLAYAAPIALATEARQIDPVAIAAGAPLPTGDTVEVAAAKAAHLHAHAVAKGRAGFYY